MLPICVIVTGRLRSAVSINSEIDKTDFSLSSIIAISIAIGRRGNEFPSRTMRAADRMNPHWHWTLRLAIMHVIVADTTTQHNTNVLHMAARGLDQHKTIKSKITLL